MHRFFLALVVGAMVFLGDSSARADKPKQWVHWTLRRASETMITLDRPWVVDGDVTGSDLCDARGIRRSDCLVTHSDASRCASVVVYTWTDRDGKHGASFEETAMTAKDAKMFVKRLWGAAYKEVTIIDSDERCPGDKAPDKGDPDKPGDKTPRS